MSLIKTEVAVLFLVACITYGASKHLLTENSVLELEGKAECDCGNHSLSCEMSIFDDVICECEPGYASNFGKCDECICGDRSAFCSFKANGEKDCHCAPNYKQSGDDCLECTCEDPLRICSFDAQKNKVCSCRFRYYEMYGKCYEICHSDGNCKDGRVCKMAESGHWICDCPTNFTGRLCETHVLCEKLEPLCSDMGARCLVGDSGAFCRCPFGQTVGFPSGLCEDVCSPDKCLHGTCKPQKLDDVGTTYVCRCDAGYTGKYCEEKIRAGFFTERTAFILLLSSNVGILVLLLGVLYLMCRRRN